MGRGRAAGGSGHLQVDPVASVIGAAAALVVIAAIVLGSKYLRNFDAALVGYATATVFLAFGHHPDREPGDPFYDPQRSGS